MICRRKIFWLVVFSTAGALLFYLTYRSDKRTTDQIYHMRLVPNNRYQNWAVPVRDRLETLVADTTSGLDKNPERGKETNRQTGGSVADQGSIGQSPESGQLQNWDVSGRTVLETSAAYKPAGNLETSVPYKPAGVHEDGDIRIETSSDGKVTSEKHLLTPGRLCGEITGESSYVWVQCKPEQTVESVLPKESSVVEVKSLPSERYMPEIGNGHIATVVRSDTIYMNGLYNGANTSSHRARIPATAAVIATRFTPQLRGHTKYSLDFGRGVFSEVYTTDSYQVTLRRYAHRSLPHLIVTELLVSNRLTAGPLTISLAINSSLDSKDIDFTHQDKGSYGILSGRTREAEYSTWADVRPAVTVVYSKVPRSVTVNTTTPSHLVFLTSVSSSPAEAVSSFEKGLSMMKNGTLFSSNVAEWNDVWRRGCIRLEGNTTLAKTTYASLYYILSSLPLKNDRHSPFVGLAPGGLAHGALEKEYQGHVFWDQDTWMFPPIMLLHADLGEIIVSTRIRTHTASVHYAHMTNYSGARYAWESAFTGLEVSPSNDTGSLEQHITGDVSLMMRQYLQLTNDTDFLRQGGYKVLADIADFWVSRTTWNASLRAYEIRGVMGPDEYVFPVNNSVYTNVIAALSMKSAVYAARMLNLSSKPEWQQVASQMYILFDAKNQFHPEHDNYTTGDKVKQADTILLGFPLEWPIPDQVRANNLLHYAKAITEGPAMTWGMFAVNWLRLGEKAKADEAFFKGTYNVKGPFLIWTEDADGGGATNFHTGMGGFLQSILFGYAGFQLSDSHLNFNPRLPPSLTYVSLTGIDYMGNSFDLDFDSVVMNITLSVRSSDVKLRLGLPMERKRWVLKVGVTVTVKRQPAVLFAR